MIGTIGGLVRVLSNLVGLFCIIAGVVFSFKLFNMIYAALKNPDAFIEIYGKWNSAINEFLSLPNFDVQIAAVASLVILGAGVLTLIWIAFEFMRTGAKIVSWTTSDREAIKKILEYTIGYRIRNAAAPAAAQKTETAAENRDAE